MSNQRKSNLTAALVVGVWLGLNPLTGSADAVTVNIEPSELWADVQAATDSISTLSVSCNDGFYSTEEFIEEDPIFIPSSATVSQPAVHCKYELRVASADILAAKAAVQSAGLRSVESDQATAEVIIETGEFEIINGQLWAIEAELGN